MTRDVETAQENYYPEEWTTQRVGESSKEKRGLELVIDLVMIGTRIQQPQHCTEGPSWSKPLSILKMKESLVTTQVDLEDVVHCAVS